MEMYLVVILAIASLITAVITARTSVKRSYVASLENQIAALASRVVVLESEVRNCETENAQFRHDIKAPQAENLGLLQRIVQDGGRIAAIKPTGSAT